MYYTLWYAGFKDVEIQLVECAKQNDLLTLIIVDKTHVLNYNWGTVEKMNDIQSHLKLVERFDGLPVNQAVLKQEETIKY